MRRRDLIGAICGAALALPFGAAAQQPGKLWRIGHVLPFTPERGGTQFAQLLEQRLTDLGDIEGRNIVLLTPLSRSAARQHTGGCRFRGASGRPIGCMGTDSGIGGEEFGRRCPDRVYLGQLPGGDRVRAQPRSPRR